MPQKTKNGFSLVEVLVVSGIASLFLILVMQLFRQASVSQPKVTSNLQLQTTVLTGTNKMLRSVREGMHFVVPRLEENSPALVFIDHNGDFRAIYAVEDPEYSKTYKRKLYRLVEYTANAKTFNLGSPIHDPQRITSICRYVAEVSFCLSSSQSVTARIKFANESQEFEILTEASLMNAGESI